LFQPNVVQFDQQPALADRHIHRCPDLPHSAGQLLGPRARCQQRFGVLLRRQRQPRRRLPAFRVFDLLVPFGQQRLSLGQGRRHASVGLGQPPLVAEGQHDAHHQQRQQPGRQTCYHRLVPPCPAP
jgi:hypothetical protein